MARSRNIKPGFFHNEDLVELPYEARLMFIGLWTLADREGRLENRPKKIKMQLFPADDLDVPKTLLRLAEVGVITIYGGGSDEFIEIGNFLKHQHPHHKEAVSTIPSPDKTRDNPSDSLNPITDSLNPDSLKSKGKKLTLDIKAMRAMCPHDVGKQLWDEYLQLRSRKKAEKTERAMNAIIKSLVDCMENGVSRQNMIEMCVEMGWKGVDYEWYKNKKGDTSGESSKEFEDKDYQAGAQTELPPGWE